MSLLSRLDLLRLVRDIDAGYDVEFKVKVKTYKNYGEGGSGACSEIRLAGGNMGVGGGQK